MAVNTNDFVLRYAVESSTATVGTSSEWRQLEPDDIGTFGATLTTIERNPISQDRMAKKGAITDLDSAFDFNGDLTVDAFMDFSEGMLMSSWLDKKVWEKQKNNITSVVASTDTITVSGTTASLAQYSLIYASGFTNSGNNGVKTVTSSTATTIVTVDALVDEGTPGSAARVEVCGYQFTSGDLVVNTDGNLTCTTADFTTLPLNVGQYIYVGGGTAGTSFAETDYSGYARIVSIAANLLTLEDYSSDWAGNSTGDSGAGKTVRIFYGGFIRNVGLDSGDVIKDRSYMFEASYADGATTYYEYAKGNRANTMSLSMALASKVTCSWAFVGTDTPAPSTSAARGGGTPVITVPYKTDAFNTTNDFGRISLKNSSGTEMGTYFTNIDLEINNNAGTEKVLGTLGAMFTNFGDFTVTGSGNVIFSGTEALAAVRNNETVSFSVALQNDDGAFMINIPSMTIGSATKSFPRNEKVKVDLSQAGFKDDTYGFVLGVSYFPYIPA